MSKFDYTEEERKINKVLVYQDVELKNIKEKSDKQCDVLDSSIKDVDKFISNLGYDTSKINITENKSNSIIDKRVLYVSNWDDLVSEAEKTIKHECVLEDLFTEEELQENSEYIAYLNEQFNSIHRLDKYDYVICGSAAVLAATLNILFVGIPHSTTEGLKAGSLENYIRQKFDDLIPKGLDKEKFSKVSFDAQDNRHTMEYVDGLSAYYHRLLELGHDPFLGLFVGVADILTGKMTTIDKKGKIVVQVIEIYSDRQAKDIFEAIAKEIVHLASDINTEMGLPVPLMGLFSFLQIGDINGQTIAEIVQGMYYQGYDFIHFCSQSVPLMVLEVIVRLAYSIKRIREGIAVKDSIPLSLNREKNPKLSTMLWIAHSGCTMINAGQVYFTKNPMSINYPEWIAFAKYSFTQVKWVLHDKPELRDRYVHDIIDKELMEVYADIDELFDEYSKEYQIVFTE